MILTSGFLSRFKVDPFEGQGIWRQKKIVVNVESILDVIVNWNIKQWVKL